MVKLHLMRSCTLLQVKAAEEMDVFYLHVMPAPRQLVGVFPLDIATVWETLPKQICSRRGMHSCKIYSLKLGLFDPLSLITQKFVLFYFVTPMPTFPILLITMGCLKGNNSTQMQMFCQG